MSIQLHTQSKAGTDDLSGRGKQVLLEGQIARQFLRDVAAKGVASFEDVRGWLETISQMSSADLDAVFSIFHSVGIHISNAESEVLARSTQELNTDRGVPFRHGDGAKVVLEVTRDTSPPWKQPDPKEGEIDLTALSALASALNRELGASFSHLLRLAGLSPQRDLRFCDWSGVSFDGEDLRGFDFTGANLRDCTFRAARIGGAKFDEAEVFRAQLATALDVEPEQLLMATIDTPEESAARRPAATLEQIEGLVDELIVRLSRLKAPAVAHGLRGLISVDPARDALLTDFGKKTLDDRYVLPDESYQQMFARVATAYSDNAPHAQRLYDYMSKLWFMPATPVLSNGGTGRGLPVSGFVNGASDSLESIIETWSENIWIADNGGGIGTYWGEVRSIGETFGQDRQATGIIPFIRVMDSLTLAISQGSMRRGSVACYLDIHHPEIEEFLEIRKAAGDFNRKSLNVHHGINITDEFMEAVREDKRFELRSPKTKLPLREVSARNLWQKILETRMATGEPYLLFIDTVNNAMPAHQTQLGFKVRQSNLCTEIMLHTGLDHLGLDRTAVCCLSSVNVEKFLEWKGEEMFLEDVFRFLDNVLEDFIKRAPPEMHRAVYSAKRERSVGLGLMGFHSFLQSQGVAMESSTAKSWNNVMFKHLRRGADAASVKLAKERGPCPDAEDMGVMARFSHKLAIAPTASISIICGGTSAGIEPIPANIYTHKTLSGSFSVKNPFLEEALEKSSNNTPGIWASILEHEGSVQHLDCLSEQEKLVFRTAFEIDQRWIIELAADRTPYVCQSQSVSLFLPADVDKWDLHMLHWSAWEKGLKSLYYCRSKSIRRVGEKTGAVVKEQTDYDECLACQ